MIYDPSIKIICDGSYNGHECKESIEFYVYEDWMKSGHKERSNALLKFMNHKGWTIFDCKHLCTFCSDQPSKIEKGAYLENRG